MADLALFDQSMTRTEDSLVEMLSSWKCVFECFDAGSQVRVFYKEGIYQKLDSLLERIIRLPEPSHPLFTLCFAILVHQLSLLTPATIRSF